MAFRPLLGIGMALVAAAAWSQAPVDAPDWAEEAIALPPTFSKDKLIPIEMPRYVTLNIGIDPETVVVGSDGVVRYVVVMRNASGSSTAAYEGILCAKGEVKTYARTSAAGTWVPVPEPEWKPLTDNLPSRHAYAIAQQGACDARTPGRREDIIKSLKQSRRVYE